MDLEGKSGVAKKLTDTQLVNAIAEMPVHSVALLYGAGASRSSGVLLASEIVHDLCLTGYCQEYAIRDAASRERVTRQDVQSWLELNDWYSEAKLRGESEYSSAFRQFKPTYEHQITYIRQLLDGKRPSKAYEALAILAHEGYFGLLLTTNFDPLFENCYRARYAHELSLRTISKIEDFRNVTIDRDRKQLAYLHGNLDGYFIANIDEDTLYLKDGTADAVGRLLDPYQLVVVGYSGRDSSVMSVLTHLAEHRPSCFRHGVIYWCHRPGEDLSEKAQALLDKVAQGFEVEVHGFDKLIERLCHRVAVAGELYAPTRLPAFSDEREIATNPAILNAAMIMRFPDQILSYRTGIKDPDDLERFRDKHSWWQAALDDGFLYVLGNPEELPSTLLEKCSANPEPIQLTNESASGHWSVFAKLANAGLRKFLLDVHRLRYWKYDRFFFEKPRNADERKVKYTSRRRKTRRSPISIATGWRVFLEENLSGSSEAEARTGAVIE
jgi:NAD-dependent SIR2 family protein deacetylase